jgi:uncharacterized membrane protein YccC
MVFETIDITTIIAAVLIVAVTISYAARTLRGELWSMVEELKRIQVSAIQQAASDPREAEFQKAVDEMKQKYPDKFQGLEKADPTKKQ